MRLSTPPKKWKPPHGLTQEQEKDRTERNEARKNYYWTTDLEQQLNAYKGKGQGKNKRAASEHTVQPKAWREMSREEKLWLKALWDGTLLQEKQAAESKCRRVQAEPFYMHEDP